MKRILSTNSRYIRTLTFLLQLFLFPQPVKIRCPFTPLTLAHASLAEAQGNMKAHAISQAYVIFSRRVPRGLAGGRKTHKLSEGAGDLIYHLLMITLSKDPGEIVYRSTIFQGLFVALIFND
uniref:RxLR effector candidate protein n=1 Tax=Hyaloperonospora arabidopsidis (strain Emoy2) TaxID=559515 RepID=M4C3Z3_HYAAE